MNNLKQPLLIGAAIAVVLIIAIIYTVVIKNPATAPSVPVNNTDNSTETEKYVNEYSGWEFSYPKGLFEQKSTSIYLPHNNEEVPVEAAFQHEIPIEYCDLSGKCRPTTVNMSFGVTELLTTRVRDYGNELRNSSIGSLVKTKKIYGWNVHEVQLGAEGEGIVYYFIEKPNRTTFLAYWKYIDENTLINYKTASDFIPIEEQSEIFEEIVQNLILNLN